VYNYQAQQQQVKRPRKRGRKLVIWVVVLLVLLVGLDFGAKAFAESEAASQIQSHGFPTRPSVSIAGFPFLTQVITRHFDQVTISAANIPEVRHSAQLRIQQRDHWTAARDDPDQPRRSR
jgi:LmeA-like phospholipid-binding